MNLEPNKDLYLRALKTREKLLGIVHETKTTPEQELIGRKKVLLVSHGGLLRALASRGVNPDNPEHFKDTFIH